MSGKPKKNSLFLTTHSFTGDGITKELAGDCHHTPSDKQAHTPFVEEFECEVIDGDLPDAQDDLGGPLDQPDRGGHLSHLPPPSHGAVWRCFTKNVLQIKMRLDGFIQLADTCFRERNNKVPFYTQI